MTTPQPLCPLCGRALTVPAVRNGDTTPLVCLWCFRGWWNTELTTTARALYDSVLRDYGLDPAAWVLADQVDVEAAAADVAH